MADPQKPVQKAKSNELVPTGRRPLTAREFQGLADVPSEVEWNANIENRRTRRAYQIDIKDFMSFTAIVKPEEFRIVTRPCHRLAKHPRSATPVSLSERLAR